jgi:hypothetical protein
MKFTFVAFVAVFYSVLTSAQAIDNSNYYTFFTQKGNLNWLRSNDAVPIIIDELVKNKIPYYTIGIGELLKINDSLRLVITVSFRKGEKEFGFLYQPTHGLPLNYEDRNYLLSRSPQKYVESEKDLNGNRKFMQVDSIPSNIFLLKETCYWFEFDSKATKYPVSKEVAESILRQDVRNFLVGL